MCVTFLSLVTCVCVAFVAIAGSRIHIPCVLILYVSGSLIYIYRVCVLYRAYFSAFGKQTLLRTTHQAPPNPRG